MVRRTVLWWEIWWCGSYRSRILNTNTYDGAIGGSSSTSKTFTSRLLLPPRARFRHNQVHRAVPRQNCGVGEDTERSSGEEAGATLLTMLPRVEETKRVAAVAATVAVRGVCQQL